MPTITGTDTFAHNDFTVPGGGPYSYVTGTPAQGTANPQELDAQYLLCSDVSVAEYVEYQNLTPPSLGWSAFYFRVNTGEEPADNTIVSQIWTVGFAQAVKLYYIPAANELSITVADVDYSNASITLDAWHWVEMIFDPRAATHSVYWQVDEVDQTSQSDSGGGAADTVQFIDIGAWRPGWTARFSHFLCGVASSTSDWLGDPGGVTASSARMLLLGAG